MSSTGLLFVSIDFVDLASARCSMCVFFRSSSCLKFFYYFHFQVHIFILGFCRSPPSILTAALRPTCSDWSALTGPCRHRPTCLHISSVACLLFVSMAMLMAFLRVVKFQPYRSALFSVDWEFWHFHSIYIAPKKKYQKGYKISFSTLPKWPLTICIYGVPIN